MKAIHTIRAIFLPFAVMALPLAANASVVGSVDEGNANPFGFYNDTGEYQQVYSSSAFSGSIAISSLTFYDFYKSTGDALMPVPFSIYLSTTSAGVGALSPTLANNVGADQTLVYAGTPPAESIIGGKGAYTFSLPTDFTYNPSDGNLLLTVINETSAPPLTPETYLDADDSGSLMSRAFSPSGTLATTDSVGLVTGFNVASAPSPGTVWLMLAGLAALAASRRRLRPMRKLPVTSVILVLAALIVTAPGWAAPKGAAHKGAKPPAANPQAYTSFIKGAQVTPGLIAIIQKKGNVFFSLSPAQFGKDFIETSVPSSGLGGLGPAEGEPYVAPARVLHFERVGNKVVLRWPNRYTITRPGSPQAMGVRNSLPNSVIAVVPISAQDGDHVVIAADAFLDDIADFSGSLNSDDDKPTHHYSLDPKRTFFLAAKAFPLNDMLRVDQSWVAGEPTKLDNAPDSRYLELRMTYNLIAAPDDGYIPRIYDPRIGYFAVPLINFTTDDEMQRAVHYISRWNFGNRTSSAPFKATNPIVFYLSDDIPAEYRETVRKALLTWGQAFAQVGIEDAVAVQDQPDTKGWDPDDIRHNMVRWIDTSSPAYGAEALITADPRSGEELNVGVNFDAALGMIGRLSYKYVIAPARGVADTPDAERKFTDDFIQYIVLHESGHDMGLQHNFIGSMAYTAQNLQDKSFTAKYGIGSSVMEYEPFNLWPKGTPQGDYNQLVLGPYDQYAIQYGYGYVPGSPEQQLPTLRGWASKWADPRYRFASDEDADAFSVGHSIDPRVQTWDLTNDPLQWCATQESMMRRLMNAVDQRFPESGMPYDQARAAFLMPLQLDLRCTTMAANVIGGEYLSRSLKGDPNAIAPLTPVPIARERAAWNALRDGLFSDAAWKFNPSVLETLTYSEDSSVAGDPHWGYDPPPRHDVPVVTIVGNAQRTTLHALFSPLTMERLDDMSTKYAPGQTMDLANLFDWAQAGIFDGLASGGAHDGLIRRNLQTSYARLLTQMLLAPDRRAPSDARSLARLELQNLARDASTGAPHASSEVERAHLEGLAALAEQALHAQATLMAPMGSM